jgi:hypothetical protein
VNTSNSRSARTCRARSCAALSKKALRDIPTVHAARTINAFADWATSR